MAIKEYKPTSPGRRGMTSQPTGEVTKSEPEKSLVVPLRKKGGRNNKGRVTIRHRGGGAKRNYRIIDFKRNKRDIPGKVAAIEYDPNRSANIALINYVDGEKRYILAPTGLKVGDRIMAGQNADIKVGNALPLRRVPTGVPIHNVELQTGKGGELARGAGTAVYVRARESDGYVMLTLPSKEVRYVRGECLATIGQVGNSEHTFINWGKAGRRRYLGRRPKVRGSAMNPYDHPHGGGEGRAPIGLPGPKTPWGKQAYGVKTRRNKRSDNRIVKRRK